MCYRRKLPHWHPDKDEASFLFVTWRLSGSIPQVRLPQRLAGESACPTSPAAGLAFLASDREADKAAFGPVWLKDPRIANVVLRAETHLPVITRWLKGSTARQANLILGRTGKAFWQDESFDHRVRDEVELARIVHYVEHNPVSAGLVSDPADWPWSSARLAGESACPTIAANLGQM